MPAKCEIQKAGTTVYSKNAQSWHFSSTNRRLRVFLQVFQVSISLLEYVGCFSSVMTAKGARLNAGQCAPLRLSRSASGRFEAVISVPPLPGFGRSTPVGGANRSRRL
jgi:hypothetical protein